VRQTFSTLATRIIYSLLLLHIAFYQHLLFCLSGTFSRQRTNSFGIVAPTITIDHHSDQP
jgi:hypothetical protein